MIPEHSVTNVSGGGCCSLLEERRNQPEELNINCVDPLNRSALITAIENENIDLIRILLEWNIDVKSWEAADTATSTFTPDITPLILAAHTNNYEILKILLGHGASLPTPHDVRCACDECATSSETDSLRHSQSRINAYRALTSPSFISLSSRDPLLTAFELSREIRRLSRMENEFRDEYNAMRSQCQEFATALLDHIRTSLELEVILNHNPDGEEHWDPGERQTLERLKLAIKYKQKQFVAHPNVQQLLAAIWYEGLPGFRRKNVARQLLEVAKLGVMFPVYSTIYMLAPTSKMGMFMKKPFVKFICHSSSYAFFLSLIWFEVRSLWTDGLLEYINDLWNIVDFIMNAFYLIWISLRFTSWYIVQKEYLHGDNPWYPREQWDPYDPMLLSEGAFAAGMIVSYMKLVHVFSINPHLGPLQISLGRMIIDILKFFFIYSLVLFAFGCGMNQLLWYYADLEKRKCYHTPDGLGGGGRGGEKKRKGKTQNVNFSGTPQRTVSGTDCALSRSKYLLFETSQSLFWASFGLIDLMAFELKGIKSFTRFWALLMFGSYSVINIIVLLNMLIAMMSNSYQIISERADTEWKFARSRLWMSYFEEGDTVPPPFNIIPTIKSLSKYVGCRKNRTSASIMRKSHKKALQRHETVMRLLIRRYITEETTKRDRSGVTEDDVMEIRQDISTLRYELIDILKNNGMRTPMLEKYVSQVPGKKNRIMERRLKKGFQIALVEGIVSEVIGANKEPHNVFSKIARAVGHRASGQSKKKDWNAMVRQSTTVRDPIESSRESDFRQSHQSMKRHTTANYNTALVSIDAEKLIKDNPRLSLVTPATRLAYAKFKV
ncbi:Transient receptor potential protein, partial [Zootermopsis nevadensis]